MVSQKSKVFFPFPLFSFWIFCQMHKVSTLLIATLTFKSLQLQPQIKKNTYKLQPRSNLSSCLLGCNLNVFDLFEAAIEEIETKGCN